MRYNRNMIRKLSIWAIICLLAFPASAQDDEFLKKQYSFYHSVKGGYEGYQSSDCTNTINYHSLRNDIRDGPYLEILMMVEPGLPGLQPLILLMKMQHSRSALAGCKDLHIIQARRRTSPLPIRMVAY